MVDGYIAPYLTDIIDWVAETHVTDDGLTVITSAEELFVQGLAHGTYRNRDIDVVIGGGQAVDATKQYQLADLVVGDAIRDETVAVGKAKGACPQSVVLSESEMWAIMTFESRYAGIRITDMDAIREIQQSLRNVGEVTARVEWNGTAMADLITRRNDDLPMREQLSDAFYDHVREISKYISAVEWKTGVAVRLLLLLASRSQERLKPVSIFCDQGGIASKATVARHKQALVSAGTVEVERMPMGVGRPQDQLLLADDKLAQCSREAFYREVVGALSHG